MPNSRTVTINTLIEHYDSLLLDAYGVLVDKQGPLPGAVNLIHRLNEEARSYLLLTNSASRLPESMADDLQRMGLDINSERILSSGMLLQTLFEQRDLHGACCLVLGPNDALEYVRRAGGIAYHPGESDDADVVVIADQKGFELQSGLDETLSLLIRRFDRGERTELLLCNPDLVYPISNDRFGFTSGALGAMLDRVLAERYPENAPQFEPLGKPHRPIFEAASQRTGGKMIMLGDQLSTDVLGARNFGIDAALVLTGLARAPLATCDVLPDYIVKSLVS